MSDQVSEQGQVSETSGLDADRVQGGIQGEAEPSTAAVREQEGDRSDERADEQVDEADLDDDEVPERHVGWEDEA